MGASRAIAGPSEPQPDITLEPNETVRYRFRVSAVGPLEPKQVELLVDARDNAERLLRIDGR